MSKYYSAKHKRSGFTLLELLMVIAIIALLMAILMPALARVRKQAKSVICKSNLRQWGDIFAMYLDDNGDYFWQGKNIVSPDDPTGITDNWARALVRYAGTDFEFWCCPLANKPKNDEQGYQLNPGGPFTAWGIKPADWVVPYAYGSYGLNKWVVYPDPQLDRHDGQCAFGAGHPCKNCWGNANVKDAGNIPLFLGCKNPAGFPYDTDVPPPGVPPGQMNKFCINRHDGAINGLFLDLSVRRVPLKCLWNFKWHRYFDIYALDPQTYDWPEWMDKFEDDCE